MMSHNEKSALTELNQRMQCYVMRVRCLGEEGEAGRVRESVGMLEEELRALKTAYGTHISQLSTTLDTIVSQKAETERQLESKRDSETRLSHRLAVEEAKVTRLLHELSGLHSEMSVKEQENISNCLTVQQLRLDNNDEANKRGKLQRDFEESKLKNVRYEDQMLKYENDISSLTQKIEFQDNFFSKKLKDMKGKLEEYLQKMVEMDFKVGESKQRELEWPLLLERVHKTAEEEFNRFKSEAEVFFHERISNIQKQLDIEISENTQLKKVNEDLNQRLLQMRKVDVELRSKIEQLQRQSDILDQTLKKDKEDSGKTIMSLQNKIRQLQDNFRQELEDVKTGRGLSDVQIKGEIEFLKRLLSEEEKRLHIERGDQQYLESSEQIQPGNDNLEDVGEEDVDDGTGNRYMNNTSVDEFLQYETEIERETEQVENFEQRDGYTEDDELLNGCNQWSNRPNGETSLKTSNIVGPVFYSEQVVGPVRPLSSLPHPPNQRPPRPASANIRGIRSKTVNSQPDCGSNKVCSSRSSNHRADSGLGQSPDYFDSVFRKKDNEENNRNYDEDSINLTSIKVVEVNKEGKYIRICNSSDTKDTEIGSFIIKQNRFSHPISVFRFPERVKLPANGTVTIWSGSNDPLLHQPPTDFFCQEPQIWGCGPEYTTILCNPQGQAVSWTTQPHRIQPDPYRPKTTPAIYKEKKKENQKRLPELIPNNSATITEQSYMIRDNDNTLSNPIHHPFTSTPKSSIHPCLENNRGKIIGNDNSSLNRQTRHQSDGIPDPMIGQPYTGTNGQRVVGSARIVRYYPANIQPSHSINNRTPEILFRSATEPPSTFQKPLSRFLSGLDQVQSMHNHFYNPPMFSTETQPSAN